MQNFENRRLYLPWAESMTHDKRQEALEKARTFFGYVPNLIVEMSQNPATTDAYVELLSVLRRDGTLTHTEQHIVMLAIAAWNRCEYCLAMHRTAAKRAGVAQSELDRVSRIEIPADGRLQALVTATWALIDQQGWLGRDGLEAFELVGIEKAQLYEIIGLIAAELIANYVDHIHGSRLDAAIVSQRFPGLPDSDR